MKGLDEKVMRLALPQHGAFSRRQAKAVGASPSACDRRVAKGVWRRTSHPFVYVLVAVTASYRQRLMAAVLAGPADTLASHRAAAVLHGIRKGTPIEVTVPLRARHNLGPVRVHQADVVAVDRCVVDGVPTTRIERTLLDLAGIVDDDVCERAVEAAFGRGLTSPERLLRRLNELAAPGRAGIVRLRRVLKRRAAGRPAGSELEVRMVQLLRAAGLPEPVRQHEVRVGGERFFLDLAYPERRLAIELDGAEHHQGSAFEHDRRRQNLLVLAGWTVIRFTWADVTERAGDVAAVVARAQAA